MSTERPVDPQESDLVRFARKMALFRRILTIATVAAALLFAVIMSITEPTAIPAIIFIALSVGGIVYYVVRGLTEHCLHNGIRRRYSQHIRAALHAYLPDAQYDPTGSIDSTLLQPMFGGITTIYTGSDLIQTSVQGCPFMICDLTVMKNDSKDRLYTLHQGCTMALKTNLSPKRYVGGLIRTSTKVIGEPDEAIESLLPAEWILRVQKAAYCDFRVGVRPDGWLLLAINTESRVFTFGSSKLSWDDLQRLAHSDQAEIERLIDRDVQRLRRCVTAVLSHPILPPRTRRCAPMKKLLTLILGLLLTLTGIAAFCHAEAASPLLVPAEDGDLPAGRYVLLSGDRVYVEGYLRTTFAVHDLASGTTLPLTLRPEDTAHWQSFLPSAAPMPEGDALLQSLLGTGSTPAFAPGDRYALCEGDAFKGLIDTETGMLLPLPDAAASPEGMTAWDQLIVCDRTGGTLTLRLLDVTGSEQHAAAFAYEGYPLVLVFPTEDGLLLQLLGNADAEQNRPVAFVLLDRTLNAGPVIPLGTYGGLPLFTGVWQSAATGTLLIQGYGLDGVMAVDPVGGACTLLAENLSAPLVNGMSADGGYALISSADGSLYHLDIASLTLTLRMSGEDVHSLCQAALAAMGAQDSFTLRPGFIQWNGGSHAVSEYLVFRVNDR